MFAYYGRKQRIAYLYPEPDFDDIIEPFCGAAAYSLHGSRYQRYVHLYDADEHVVDAWRWLIMANFDDVMSLPILQPGDRVDAHGLCPGAMKFLGFCISASPSSPKMTATVKTNWNANSRSRIAQSIHKVDHWSVDQLDFREVKHRVRDARATWFIDPPYQVGGEHYRTRFKTGDYRQLAHEIFHHWKGQKIVCERENANWIWLRKLCDARGQKNQVSAEGIAHIRDHYC